MFWLYYCCTDNIFICYLAVPWPALGHYWEHSLTHLKCHQESSDEVGSLSPAECLSGFFFFQRIFSSVYCWKVIHYWKSVWKGFHTYDEYLIHRTGITFKTIYPRTKPADNTNFAIGYIGVMSFLFYYTLVKMGKIECFTNVSTHSFVIPDKIY